MKNKLFSYVLLVGLFTELIQASPRRRTFVVTPLETIVEEIDSDDELCKSRFSTLSQPTDFLFHAIEHGQLDNAKNIVRDRAVQGCFVPSIAIAAVSTLHRSSHSTQIYHTVSPRDRKNSNKHKNNERDFISVIPDCNGANPIISSQVQARNELNKSRLAAIYNKVNHIMQNSK